MHLNMLCEPHFCTGISQMWVQFTRAKKQIIIYEETFGARKPEIVYDVMKKSLLCKRKSLLLSVTVFLDLFLEKVLFGFKIIPIQMKLIGLKFPQVINLWIENGQIKITSNFWEQTNTKNSPLWTGKSLK